jgi:hypothetical protein
VVDDGGGGGGCGGGGGGGVCVIVCVCVCVCVCVHLPSVLRTSMAILQGTCCDICSGLLPRAHRRSTQCLQASTHRQCCRGLGLALRSAMGCLDLEVELGKEHMFKDPGCAAHVIFFVLLPVCTFQGAFLLPNTILCLTAHCRCSHAHCVQHIQNALSTDVSLTP